MREARRKKDLVKFWGGGDAKYVSEMLGLVGGFNRDGCNCPWCDIHNKDMGNLRVNGNPRTLKEMYNLGHLPYATGDDDGFPFSCPVSSCWKMFGSKEDVDNDKGPGSKTACDAYHQSHKMVGWHRPPVLDIEPWMVSMCVLHMLLSQTRQLIKHAVMPYITDENRDDLLQFLVDICKVHSNVKSASESAATKDARVPKLTGRECKMVLAYFLEILKILHVPDEKMEETMIVVRAFIEMFNLITDRATTQQAREEKANKLDVLAATYVEAYLAWTSGTGAVYYTHFIAKHLAEQYRRFPVDLLDCSGEGIENLNQKIKQHCRKTNGHRGGKRKRCSGDGYFDCGMSYIAQALSNSAIRDCALHTTASVDLDVRAHSQKKRTYARKVKAYVSRIDLKE